MKEGYEFWQNILDSINLHANINKENKSSPAYEKPNLVMCTYFSVIIWREGNANCAIRISYSAAYYILNGS